jgi:tetratricopeptide (TPR) repeat protein
MAFSNRGSAYSDKGDNDRAIADYGEAIRINPKQIKAIYNRGVAWLEKGDNDRAIADYTEVIRLDPKDPDPLDGRGLVYRIMGEYDRAITDYNAAIKLDPKSSKGFVGRGAAYQGKGDNDRAIADYNEAIRLDPKSALAYSARGRAYLFAGSIDKALADFNQAGTQAPKNAYMVLWADIIGRRNKLPSRLAQTSSQLNMAVWPAPIVKMLMDQMTPADLLAAADDPDAIKKNGQICEVNFYSGELSLAKGAKDEAIRLFRLAAGACPHSFNEWNDAVAELKALGTSQ